MEKEYLGYYMIKSGKCSKLYEKELFRFNKKNEKKDYIFFHNHNSPKFYPSIQDIFLIFQKKYQYYFIISSIGILSIKKKQKEIIDNDEEKIVKKYLKLLKEIEKKKKSKQN